MKTTFRLTLVDSDPVPGLSGLAPSLAKSSQGSRVVSWTIIQADRNVPDLSSRRASCAAVFVCLASQRCLHRSLTRTDSAEAVVLQV